MVQELTRITNEKDWLEARKSGIGGSEAASILGLHPYKTNIELWEEKTGRRIPEDISKKEQVKYGKKAEKHLRELFKLDFPQFKLHYDRYKIFRGQEHPFILATLDGWLEGQGKTGILEIKTTEIMQSGQWQQWKDKLPDLYYIQCLHQLLATGFDFVILKAQIKSNFNGNLRLETKHYTIERLDVTEDLKYLKEKEIEFWTNYVVPDIRPGLMLPSI